MLLFKKIIVCLFILSLIGCGFRPLYPGRTNDHTQPTFLTIDIAPIKNREGQVLRTELTRHLYSGREQMPAVYRLVTNLSEEKTLFGVKKNAFATRANLKIVSHFTLFRLLDHAQVFSDSSHITVSYNVLNAEFASHMTEKQARERGLRAISENMRTRLAAYLDQKYKK